MKRIVCEILVVALATILLTGCGTEKHGTSESVTKWPDAVTVRLQENGDIVVDGATEEQTEAVTVGHDIVYYEAGRDFTYGEGSEADSHSAEEAAAHTVVHITEPGTYVLEGTLSAGQIAVDLGEGAEEDPAAVVTLVLNGVDISCSVAPAVIFYRVYECGSADVETAEKNVDTSAAGANVVLADDTVNYINGSYVARIYKPDTVILSEDGSEVEDAKKLHKYDAAFYSKMSMNVDGEEKGNGTLVIDAENEGLDSELHLTVNGGIVEIRSGNDGINTNEDGVSVTTINGGSVNITVTGETGEGDGIDSNGWVVINGGTVSAAACAFSGDAGVDADMGIHINGGTVVAAGNMLDRIEEGGQTCAIFQFSYPQGGESALTLKNAAGESVMTYLPRNECSNLIFSSPGLVPGEYTLWCGDTQLAHNGAGGMMGGPGGMGGGMRPKPEGIPPFEDVEMPENGDRPEPPEGMEDMAGPGGFGGGKNEPGSGERSELFLIKDGENHFSEIAAAEQRA